MTDKHPLFREIPPWDIVKEVLRLLNLSSDIPSTFQKSDLTLDNSDSAVDLLFPYYIPCKAKQFLDYTDAVRWVTILRHILHPHGYIILSQETTRQRKKTILYTIDRISVIEGPLRQAVKVDFF